MSENQRSFMGIVENSFVLVLGGVGLFFAIAIALTMVAPRFVDKTWVEPTSYFQVQMYEVADPDFYVSSETAGVRQLQYVNHLKNGFTLLAFQEGETIPIIAKPELEKYINHLGDPELKLTSRLLLLRRPEGKEMQKKAEALKERLQKEDEKKGKGKIDYQVLELYDSEMEEAFSIATSEGVYDDFVDESFVIFDKNDEVPFHHDPGVVYVKNPKEYRIVPFGIGDQKGWKYDPKGRAIASLEELTGQELGFRSRKSLIEFGENIFKVEGCWYCHTDQTRTLIQDVVLNGTESYPAPPSSPNEYIYQRTSFMGTKRNGPDLSRVAIKRPSRDWHMSHFWAPRTESPGSIMPSFKHFFDDDPAGQGQTEVGIPNYRFEAIYQYLMTKGNRITPPTQAWWLGQDPVNTIEIIEGKNK